MHSSSIFSPPRHSRGLWRLGLGVLTTLVVGCPATSAYRSADPLPVGTWEVSFAASAGALRDREQDTRLPTASAELGARRGLADGVDLGVRLYTFGTQIDSTVRLRKGAAWSIALAPSVSGLFLRDSGVLPPSINVFIQAPLIASRPLSAKWTLASGGGPGYGLFWPETGGRAHGLWASGFANLSRTVGRWRFTPEVGLYVVVLGEVPVRGFAVNLGCGVARRF